MIHFPKKNKSGFTLIEILIVIVILGIIMAIGSVRFRDFSRRQATASAKRQLLADVRAAQSDASSGRKPEGCTGALLGYGFRVTGTTGPASYEIFARCSQGAGSQDFAVIQARLPDGISITIPSVNPVIFKPLSQGTNLPSASTVTVNINSSISSITESLIIRPTGEIR